MERVELQSIHKCLQRFPKLPLWIIEYVWAHKMTDIQEGWFSQYFLRRCLTCCYPDYLLSLYTDIVGLIMISYS